MLRKNQISDFFSLRRRRLLLIFLLLPTIGYAELKKLGPDLSEKETSLIPSIQLSEKMQRFLAEIQTAEEALEKSREYQKNGQFGLAKLIIQRGIEIARSTESNFAALSNELEYELPVLQVKRLLVMGSPNQAAKILEGLAEKFSSDQKRTDEISVLLGALSQSRFLAAAKGNTENKVSRDVRRQMSIYYKKTGSFPNYAQLNKLIPAEDKILINFEIIYYEAVPNAYRMVLRNLYSPDNLLKIQATGLLK